MRMGWLVACAAAFTCAYAFERATTSSAATPEQRRPARKVASPAPSVEATPKPGLQYRSIGPAISGGRVTSTAGSDRDAMLYYAGAAGGGVWKSADGGVSWASVWENQPWGAVGAIAIDPRNDANVWVGAGEANPRNDVSWGDGVWRSSDGAKSWRHAGLSDTSQIARISVDPSRPGVVVVAALGSPWKDTTDRGIYRTTDGGVSWSKTLYVDAATGAADLVRSPRDPRVLYAAMWHFRREPWYFTSGGGRDGLYKSTDGGASWRRIIGGGFPEPPLGRIGIAVAPSRPQRVYAVVQSRRGTIWRSDDAGATWTRVSSDTMPEQRPFYFSHLAVDPRDADHVIAVSMYLSESRNGGRTWKHVTGTLHVDNHALWWSADGKRLLNGNDGGIALSNDGGKAWSMPLNEAIGQVYHVGYDLGDPYNVCGGFQDNSTWCGPSNSRNGIGVLERDWTGITGGDGTWALFDPADPERIWSDTQDGVLTIFDRRAQQSIDIEPWPRDPFTSTRGLADERYRFNWNSPVAFSPQDPHVAYFGGDAVFRTADGGRTWAAISGDLTRNEKQHQRASGGPVTLDVSGAEYYDTLLVIAPSPKDAQTMWAGTDDGLVQLTRDGGTSWKNVTPAQLPRYARIECVDVSPSDAASAYLAADRHDLGDPAPYLFATTDFGATWRRIDLGLPRSASTHVIRLDPRNPAILYAGTEQGIWYSSNRGSTWLPLQFNLPSTPVYDLQIHPVANDLIVATHGRSFWILDDLTPIQEASRVGRGAFLFPVRPGTLWAQWPPIEGGDQNSLPGNVFVGQNPKGPALITFWQDTPAKVRPAIEVVDAAGNVIRHLSGSFQTDEGLKYWVTNVGGYNRLAWDGIEDGPVRWNGTTLQNAGPLTGAEALPGEYTIRLNAGDRRFAQPFTLRADPRNPWTAAELAERHTWLRRLYADISQIDTLLNAIDAQERALRRRRDDASVARLGALDAVRGEVTADDRRDEDSIGKPDRLRERVFALTGTIGGSYQPPFAAHRAAADAVQHDFDRIMASAKSVVNR